MAVIRFLTAAWVLIVGSPRAIAGFRLENGSFTDLRVDGAGITLIRNLVVDGTLTVSAKPGSDVVISRVRAKRIVVEEKASTAFLTIEDSDLTGLTIDQNATGVRVIGNRIVGSDQDVVEIMKDGDLCPSPAGSPGEHYFERNVIIHTAASEFERCAALRILCKTDNEFVNNVFYADACSGAYLRDNADRNMFRGNLFWKRTYANGGGAARYASGNDAPKHDPRDNTFEHNIFVGVEGPAFDAAIDSGGNTYRYNQFISGRAPSASFDGVMIPVAPAIVSGITLKDNTFLFNTFYNPDVAAVSIGGSGTPSLVFRNNVLVSGGDAVWSDLDGSVPSSWTGFESDYNVYYNTVGGGVVFERYGTLAGYRAATGGDGHSVVGNPAFESLSLSEGANRVLPRLRPESGSAAIGVASDGGTAGALRESNPGCTEAWTCSDWSEASFCPDGVRVRSCRDTNECRTISKRPDMTWPCDGGTPPTGVTPSTGGGGSADGGCRARGAAWLLPLAVFGIASLRRRAY